MGDDVSEGLAAFEARRPPVLQAMQAAAIPRAEHRGPRVPGQPRGHEALVADLHARRRKARTGGPEKAREKHLARGKLLPRDRVEALLDPGSPFLELGRWPARACTTACRPAPA
jgi:hypothetical protein